MSQKCLVKECPVCHQSFFTPPYDKAHTCGKLKCLMTYGGVKYAKKNMTSSPA